MPASSCSARRRTARSEFYTWRTAITPPAHRGEGVLLRRRRGGLARLLPGQPVREGLSRVRPQNRRRRSRRSAAGRPGCGPTARSRNWSAGWSGSTRARPEEEKVGLLRAGRVQPVGLAARGDALPARAGRPGGPGRGPAGRAVLRAVRRGRPGVRRAHGPRAGSLPRGGGRRCLRELRAGVPTGRRATAATPSSSPSRTPSW